MQQPPQQQQRDDFITAVLIRFDPTAPDNIKQQAQQYCDSIAQSPEGWRFHLQKLHEVAQSKTNDQVQFFCLSAIDETTERRYDHMNDEEKTVIRRSLMLYIRDIIPQIPQREFIKNKLCTILVKIVKHDYPNVWQSFFTDFLGLLDKGIEVIDVFIRLLKILDEDVVDQDGQHSAHDHHLNTKIKDSMRQNDLNHISDAMYTICSTYHQTHPNLVAAALESYSEYIDWIDINLVVNDRFLQLFYAFMAPSQSGTANPRVVKQFSLAPGSSSPSFGASSPTRGISGSAGTPAHNAAIIELQIHATDCLIAIVEKRMKTKKIGLLKQLRIIEFLRDVVIPTHTAPLFPTNPSQVSLPTGETPLDQFVMAIGCLIESIARELVDCVDKLWKQLQPTNVVTVQLTQQDQMDTSAALQEALVMMEQALALGYPFFEHPLYTISNRMIKCYTEYVQLLKTPTGPWATNSAEHMKRIFYSLSKSLEYPSWYQFSRDDDEEVKFDTEHRRPLTTLFINLTQINPTFMLEMLANRLNETLVGLQSLPYQTVEVTLKLLSDLTTSSPFKFAQRMQEEPFRTMIGTFFVSNISAYPHPQITLAYFDIVNRYVQFFDSNPTLIGPVLTSFIDQRGLRHPHATVRNRAAYLLMKFIEKDNKKHLSPILDESLKQIETVLEMSLTGQPNTVLVDAEGCGHLSKAMGILVSSPVTGTEACHRYVQLVFRFFVGQFESALQSQAAWYPNEQERVGLKLAQLISCVSAIMEPLGVMDGPKIEDLLLNMAQLILQIHTLLPTHKEVVAQVLAFVHRLVTCQPQMSQDKLAALLNTPNTSPPPVLQYFALTFQLLLKHANPTNIYSISEAANQIILKMKRRCEPLLDSVFLPLCTKIFEVIASYSYIDNTATNLMNGTSSNPLPAAAYSTERNERLKLQKQYYTILHSIVTQDLATVFTSATNGPHIRSVLDTILQGCVNLTDFLLPKSCFILLQSLTKFWKKQQVLQTDQAVKHFIQVEVTTALFQSICLPQFNLKDPGCQGAVRELIKLQKTISEGLGEEYLNYLSQHFLQQMFGFPSDVANQYCLYIISYVTTAHDGTNQPSSTTMAVNAQTGQEWKVFEPYFINMQQRSQGQSGTPNRHNNQ